MLMFPQDAKHEQSNQILRLMNCAINAGDQPLAKRYLHEFIAVENVRARTADDKFKHAILLLLQESADRNYLGFIDLLMRLIGAYEVNPKIMVEIVDYLGMTCVEMLSDVKRRMDLNDLAREAGIEL